MHIFLDTLDANVPLRIADIGGLNVSGTDGGSYRSSVVSRSSIWTYTACDLRDGCGVDLLLQDPYHWAILDGSFDVVISGQTLEHVGRPWLFIQEAYRILRAGGRACLIAPHTFNYHEEPIDCWRVWPDGMRELLAHGGFTVESVHRNEIDTVGIGLKE